MWIRYKLPLLSMWKYESYAKKVYASKSPGIPSSPKRNLLIDGWVKINFYAMVKEGACRGLGVVLRNSEGRVIATGTRKIESYWNVDTCEAAAAQFGLHVTFRLGVHYAHLEGDSINVV